MRLLRSVSLLAVLLALYSGAAGTAGAQTPTPPPAPSPAQLAIDRDVAPTETGTDLTSKKDIAADSNLRLLWKGRDVPPLCLDKMLMGETQLPQVPLASCEADPEKKILKTWRDKDWTKTDYAIAGEEDLPPMTAMYRVLGNTGDGVALEIYSATGGSGRFTAVVVVQIAGDQLRLIHSFGGGDRCNGGVADARVKNSMVTYGLYLTPGDFARTAFDDDRGIVPYEDVEASAASCFAIARYRNATLMEVELLPDAVKNSDSADWTTPLALQKCFNKRMSARTQGGKTILTPDEFRAFVTGFLKSCKKA